MNSLLNISSSVKTAAVISGASIWAFCGPTMPFVWLCTAMVFADLASSLMLARRINRRHKAPPDRKVKFRSRRFGSVLTTLAKTYALLLLSHGIDIVLLDGDASAYAMRFSAGLICFWQLWSILENESSSNDAAWARIAQKILIDKTERHLGIDLSTLRNTASDANPSAAPDAQ